MSSGGYHFIWLIPFKLMWIVVDHQILSRVMIFHLASKYQAKFANWWKVHLGFSRQLTNYYVNVVVSCYLLACICMCSSGISI
jgi:hypothetical protein